METTTDRTKTIKIQCFVGFFVVFIFTIQNMNMHLFNSKTHSNRYQ